MTDSDQDNIEWGRDPDNMVFTSSEQPVQSSYTRAPQTSTPSSKNGGPMQMGFSTGSKRPSKASVNAGSRTQAGGPHGLLPPRPVVIPKSKSPVDFHTKMQEQMDRMSKSQSGMLDLVRQLLKLISPQAKENPLLDTLTSLVETFAVSLQENQQSLQDLWTYAKHERSTPVVVESDCVPSFNVPQAQASVRAQPPKKLPQHQQPTASNAKGRGTWARRVNLQDPAQFPHLQPMKQAPKKKPSYREAFNKTVAAARVAAVVKDRCFRILPMCPTPATNNPPTQLVGKSVESWIKTHAPETTGRALEAIRPCPQGGVYIQCFPTSLTYVQKLFLDLGTNPMSLTSLGDWHHVEIAPSELVGKTAFVLGNIPLETDVNEVLPELIVSNPQWGLQESDLGNTLCRPRRLSRRTAPQSREWTPCRSVEFWASEPLASTLKSYPVANWGWGIVPLHLFHRQVPKCFSCGKMGHMASTCRSTPVCKWCKQGHMSNACPTRVFPSMGSAALNQTSGARSPPPHRRSSNLTKRRQLHAPDAEGWTTVGGCQVPWAPADNANDLAEHHISPREAGEAPAFAK